MPTRNTQILATIGPASLDIIPELARAGISGIRINSSHGNKEQHLDILRSARECEPALFTVYDIKGPKIRIGDLPEPLYLKAGMRLTLTTGHADSTGGYPRTEDPASGIPVTFGDLYKYVKTGDRLLLDDGLIGLSVNAIESSAIICDVMYGDILRSRKGINHPDTIIDFPYTVDEDIPNIQFAIDNNVDYIADSFERDADDVKELRSRLAGTPINIISKIENPQGVRSFDEILNSTDSVMIARGDLGVELDPWEIPELQKIFTHKCNKTGKPVIVATQMLESMIDDPRPSRSDVSDIANALYDGADVLMLSGETSSGSYPVKCVEMMMKIILKTESTERYLSNKNKVNKLRAHS